VKEVTPVPKRQLVDIKAAAAYTGLSVHTLYTMVSQRRVPYEKVGRLTKFDLGLLNEWIDDHTVMPAQPKVLAG
jgi:excisionase family DNA binding protein